MIYIETERLVLRDWSAADLDTFKAMNSDSETMEFFPNTLSPEESESFYKRIQEEIDEKGYGLYAVELKQTKRFIGFTGFHYTIIDLDISPFVEIGWRLDRSAWGHGYATEAAKACLEYAKTNLAFKEVYSFTSSINMRSENIMKKIGMTKIKNFAHPSIPVDHILNDHVLYKFTF